MINSLHPTLKQHSLSYWKWFEKELNREDWQRWALSTPDSPTMKYTPEKQKLKRLSVFSLITSILP